MKKIIITAEVDTEDLEDDVRYDLEAAVEETLKAWGYEAEVRSRVED